MDYSGCGTDRVLNNFRLEPLCILLAMLPPWLGYGLIMLIQRFIARDRFWLTNGFYLAVGWYGLQRFVWEFFKPYATLLGPFNLFHFVCFGLVLYAAAMIRSGDRACTTA